MFDTRTGSGTAVVTIEGLEFSATNTQVLALFKNQESIRSVRLMSLPSGIMAADVVFTTLDAASDGIKDFAHPGLSIKFLGDSSRPSQRRTNGSNQRGRHTHGDSSRGGTGQHRGRSGQRNISTGVPHRVPYEDFDFSSNNSKFEKEQPALNPTKAQTTTGSFFDSASLSSNLEPGGSNNHRMSTQDQRKKNAETFGSDAYTYRSEHTGNNRFRGGRGSSRGRYSYRRPPIGSESKST